MLSDPRGIWVKVDGVTRPEDARAAADAGVSAIGMIFAPSPRRVTVEQACAVRDAIPEGVAAFGVFEKASDAAELVSALRLDAVQVHAGDDAPLPAGLLVLRTVRVRGAVDLQRDVGDDVLHLDAYVEGKLGGTGVLAPWDLIEAHRPSRPFVVSGGLRPDNVAEAVRRLRPAGVDVSSGVESSPGVKDPALVRAFVDAARRA